MSNVIRVESKLDEDCCVCFEEFKGKDKTVNHEGAIHNPFHEKCLKQWMDTGRHSCPLCRELMNPDSLISRTDRIFQKAKQTLINLAFVGVLGAAAGILHLLFQWD